MLIEGQFVKRTDHNSLRVFENIIQAHAGSALRRTDGPRGEIAFNELFGFSFCIRSHKPVPFPRNRPIRRAISGA